MYDFHETLTLSLPNVEEQLSAFSESDYQKNHGLVVEIAAIHEGLTANYNYYGEAALKESLASWTQPYPKPLILNHDVETEPIGRVMGAKMETEADGTPFVKLQVAVLDPNAIAKVMDQRYLTGSVGGRATEAVCNICEADWAKASMVARPCAHDRGKTYKGKLAYLEMRDISFKEYSFVNVPADSNSTIRSLVNTTASEAETEDDWIRPIEMYSLDMNKEAYVYLAESAEDDVNVLKRLDKKKSSQAYMRTKGAFISALAAEMDNENTKESSVADDILLEGDEDILAVTDDLSADLAKEHDEPEEPAAAADADGDDEDEDKTPEGDDKKVDDEPAEPVANDDANDLGDAKGEDEEDEAAATDAEAAPEGQEKPHSEDPEDEENLPKNRESEGASETDLSESIATLESRVAELEAENATLLETNGRLKVALKRNLAERVVDMKMTLGMCEGDRDELLEEHMNRSASSLADSMRDLAAMKPKIAESAPMPTITEKTAVAEDKTLTEGDEGQPTEDETIDPEGFFTDVLMGRRSI